MADPQQSPMNGRSHRPNGERFTILLTNAGKLAGLVVGCIEALGQARPPVLLYATAIYLGAQAFEDLVMKIIERNFGDSR